MQDYPTSRSRQWGSAWLALCAALAVHVADETMTDFLSYWNPLVRSIRQQLPLAPLPTFSFSVWFGGLIVAVLVLTYLARFAFRGVWWMKPVSYFVAIVMLLNGIQHLVASVYLQRAAPGVYSSPLLIATAAYLLVSVRRYWQTPSTERSGAQQV
jgi:hypothetical protein